MEAHHVLILSGLSVEIAGAFVLAAEAIGLERLDSWTADLSRVRDEMAGTQARRGSTFLDPNRFLAGFASAGGGAVGYWLSYRLTFWPSPIAKAAAVGVGALAGGVLGVILYQGALATLRATVHALKRIEARVRVRAVGVLGFGLLSIGFLLQFIGTFVDGLERIVQ
jgi:hypothetical protein